MNRLSDDGLVIERIATEIVVRNPDISTSTPEIQRHICKRAIFTAVIFASELNNFFETEDNA